MYAKKNSNAKLIAILLAVTLLIGCGIGGTIAWLIDDTETITNTFTTSEVTVEISEEYPANSTAKMVPGDTIKKDPKVTVSADSEYCYVFVEIIEENDFANFMEYGVDDVWTAVEGKTNVYYKEIDENTQDRTFNILAEQQVTVKSTVTMDIMGTVVEGKEPSLSFKAYAIQSANLPTDWSIVRIWNEASGQVAE